MSKTDRLAKALIKRQGKVTWCLTMIVKNEAKNMVRLLDSVKEMIDFISIDDTGSTDDTKNIIKKWGKKNKIPTAVHDEPFVNFEYNRSQSALHAKQSFPQATYLFLSDADFVWVFKDPDQKQKLYKDRYWINQIIFDEGNTTEDTSSLVYPNPRLLRNNSTWKCECLSHEAWVNDKNPLEIETLTWLYIDDRLDGGAKADKFERDELLIRQGLETETVVWKRNRYFFYLAQTLRDLGRYDEAYEWYKMRSESGGNVDEVIFSNYMLGTNTEMLGWVYKHIAHLLCKLDLTEEEMEQIKKWNPNNYSVEILRYQSFSCLNRAVDLYIAAYKKNKHFLEPLYHAVLLLRHIQRYEEAYEWSKFLASDKVKMNKMSHFLDATIYNHRRYIEYVICCFNMREIEKGSFHLSLLLNMTGLPHCDDEILGFVNDAYIAYKNQNFHEIPRLTWLEHIKPMKRSMLSKEVRQKFE